MCGPAFDDNNVWHRHTPRPVFLRRCGTPPFRITPAPLAPLLGGSSPSGFPTPANKAPAFATCTRIMIPRPLCKEPVNYAGGANGCG
jgi:hypothetical protein